MGPALPPKVGTVLSDQEFERYLASIKPPKPVDAFPKVGTVLSDQEFERYLASIKPSKPVDAFPSPLEKDEVGLLTPITEFTKGLWGSLTNGNIEMLGGAAEAFSVAAGNDKPEESIGRNVQNWIRDRTDKDDLTMGWEEAVENGPLGIISFFTGWTGQAVGSMAAPLLAGKIGASAGGVAGSVVPGLGTAAGAGAGFVVGMFGTGTLLSIGETYLQLKSEGVDPKTASAAALTIGSGLGVVDSLALGKVVGATVGKEIKRKAVREFVKQFGKGYAKGATSEGLTEMAQSAVREATAATLTGNVDLKRRAMASLEEGLGGALGGGFIGGVGRTGRMALEGRQSPQQPTPEPTPQPEPKLAPEPVVESEPAPVPSPEPVEVAEPTPSPVPAPVPVPAPSLEGPKIPARLPEKPLEGPVGKETVLHTPSTESNTRYRVVEAETLVSSHNANTFAKNPNYPEGVQERAYHANKSAQAEVIENAQNLKPELVVNSDPTAINGPPQVTPTGVVLGGNGRSMSLQRAYQDGKAEKYREYLKEHAEDFGLTKDQVGALKNPVLVREVVDSPTDIEGLRVLGRDLNRSFTKALSEVEEAVSAGKNLSVETANIIAERFSQAGDQATLRSMMTSDPLVFRDAMLRDGVLKKSDLPKYFTEEGALNPAGKDFMENALVGAAIRDADLLQSFPRSLVGKFERIVPQLLELGKRSDAWNILGDVKEAARQVTSAQIRGINLNQQLAQKTMFGEGPSAQVKTIALALSNKPTEVSAVFKQFAKEARADVENQAAMFGTADPRESFARIFGMESTESVAADTGEQVTYSHSGDRPILPSLQKAEMPKELVRRSKILDKLSKELGGLPIRLGRISQRKALGIYKVKPEVIRLRQANDIAVAMHEAGHHLNKLLYGGEKERLNWKPFQEFRDELAPIATDPGKGKSKLPEGFAEFIRLYATSPGEAIDKAPRFHRAFEIKLAEHPEIRDLLLDTREQVRRYIEQPAAAKILSHISKEDPPVPSIGRWDRVYTHAVDRLHPIKLAVEAMAKGGGKVSTENDAYKISRLFAAWVYKADVFLNKATFDPSRTEGNITGKPLRDILRPFEGKLDDLRVYLVARRALEKSKQGKETGIPVEDAREAIQELETPELKQAAQEIYRYNDEVLKYLARSEFLSKEQYEAIRELNQNYVPFYRVMESGPGASKGGTGKSMADLWSPVKRMKGSAREIVDPLESIIKNTYTFINLAERNKVALMLANQAAKSEGAGEWVEKVPARMMPTQFTLSEIKSTLKAADIDVEGIGKEDLESVATIFRPSPIGSRRENIISVFRNGKSELYQVQPDLYKALKGLDEGETNILIRLLSKPAKLLRLGATGVSPEFLSRNPIRDTWVAFLQSENGFMPFLGTIRGAFHLFKKGDLYDEFVRSGGLYSAMVSMDRTTLKKNLDDMLASKTKYAIHHPVETLRWFSEQLEGASRLEEYRLARKKGKSPKEAAFDAREVTLDFARIGASMQGWNKIAAFFNANIQGTDKLIRTFKSNPKRATVRAMASITLPSVILYAVNRDNEDYHEAPRWLRDFFWLIPTKETPLQDKTPFVPVPKPFAYGLAFGSSIERTLEWIDRKDPSAFDGFANSLLQAFVPDPMPTAIKPPIEAWANKSFFTGRDIVPRHLERLPPEYQFEPWTTEFSKGMAKMFKKAGVPASPMKIENALFGYTAGAGRAATAILNPLLRLGDDVERPTPTMADIPGIRAFAVRKTGAGESMQRFYDRLAELDQKDAAERFARRYRGSIKPERMTSAERREYDLLSWAQREMSSISTKLRRVEFSKLSAQAKRKRIDELSLQRRKIAADTMRKASRLRK